MSALATIISEYCQVCKDHPNVLGEIMRAWAFPGEGTGCYSNFDVRCDFEEVAATPREFAMLWGREYNSDDENPNEWGYYDVEEIEAIRWFKHPSGIEMGWHWDGDGMLAFYIPEQEDKFYSGVLINSDCKKDYAWEFQVRWQ